MALWYHCCRTGVPTTELWAEEFLGASEKRRLFQCFEGSQVRSGCNARPETVEAFKPKVWDGPSFYRALADYASRRELGPLAPRLNGHPVRYNTTCAVLALGLALGHLTTEWLRWRNDHALIVDTERRCPYLCNNAFLMSAPLYLEVLQRLEMVWGNATGHDFQPQRTCEERMTNVVVKLHGLHKCFVSGSFGIHPAYSTQFSPQSYDEWAVQRILEFMHSYPTLQA